MHIVIIGGGLVGLGTAYALQRLAGASVTVLDKEPALGQHQSTHNSGVLHAGLYYKPGSIKARLAVRGIRLMTAFAREHAIPHERCGKLVVATRPGQLDALKVLFDRGTENGLRDVRWLSAADARALEPHVNAVAAVHVPEEGIIDYARVVQVLGAEIAHGGGTIATAAQVTGARRAAGAWEVQTSAGPVRADFVINCAGLHCDRVAKLFGARPATRIVPFRGEYFLLRRPALVRNLIYPVPDSRMPFLGVHFTRMIGGGVECGPNAVLALHREGYQRTSFKARDALETLTQPRLWRFLARYRESVLFELRRSLFSFVFLRSLQELVPEITAADLEPGPAGVRAQAMHPDGSLVEDFVFLEQDSSLHVLNAPSPGATASLAIGEQVARRVITLANMRPVMDELPLAID